VSDKTRDYVLVLVVEDNPERVELFEQWLRHPQLRLLHVTTGDAALKCVETDPYDLILLDHDLDLQHPMGRMGSVNGTNVVARLVASRINRATFTVIHSMNPGARNRMYLTLRANGFDVQIKPFAEWTPHWAAQLRDEIIEEWRAGRS
jgi:CheY-like chemotaxis protein